MGENDELLDGIEIRETLDGKPASPSRTVGRGEERIYREVSGRNASAQPSAQATEADPKGKGKNAAATKKPKTLNRPDPYIWGIYITFLVISIVELFSASSTEVTGENVYGPLIRHAIFLGLGLGIVLWFQRTSYTIVNKFAWAFAVLSLGLLLLSNLMGEEINGAQRAIRVAGITIQPAEIVKLAVVCLLASILGRNQQPGGVSNRGVITAAIVVVVFGACLWRNGLTNTLLLMFVSISMMLIGGIQWRKFLTVMGIYAVGIGCLVMVKYVTPDTSDFERAEQEQMIMAANASNGGVIVQEDKKIDRTGTQIGRIKRFLKGVHPEDPIDDMNRQVIFSKFAMANGGLTGQGPGNSRESARLPLAFSDYIYSIIVEDTGFVGGTLIIVLFMLLVARAGRLAYKCSRAFPAFLILGCAVMIVMQAFVHMAIVVGLCPVSGQPLPFISKGGTSVLVMSTAIGIMLSVSRFAAISGNKKEINAEIKTLPEDMQAANFSETVRRS